MQGFDNTSKYFGKTIILCNTLSFCKDLPSFSLEYLVFANTTNSNWLNLEYKKFALHHLYFRMHLPAMLYMTRRVGASFSYWLIMPFWAALGTGMVTVMAVWNRRRRGSKVTMGLTATRFPSSLDTRSGEIG